MAAGSQILMICLYRGESVEDPQMNADENQSLPFTAKKKRGEYQ